MTDLPDQYEALRRSVGAVDTTRAVISAAGPDATSFLQGQLSQDVATMADRSIVFAMANPTPEIDPAEAVKHAEVVATGRSDFANQIKWMNQPELLVPRQIAAVKEIKRSKPQQHHQAVGIVTAVAILGFVEFLNAIVFLCIDISGINELLATAQT